MQRILGKRGSTGKDDNEIMVKRKKEDESTGKDKTYLINVTTKVTLLIYAIILVSILNLPAACYIRLAMCLENEEIDCLAATCKAMKKNAEQCREM